MTRARSGLALVLGAALLVSGCAAARFLAGAPRPGARGGTALAGGPAPAGPAESAASGQALLARRCAGCHAVPEPARMTPGEWQRALARMQLRMRLPAAEWDSLAALRARD